MINVVDDFELLDKLMEILLIEGNDDYFRHNSRLRRIKSRSTSRSSLRKRCNSCLNKNHRIFHLFCF